MIGGLFFINIVVALVILLTTSMLQNHFARIEKSIRMYNDPKGYETKTETSFLYKLVQKYKALTIQGPEKIDVEAMIASSFYEEKIGKFPYIKVQSIALEGKFIMWIILVLQIGFEILGQNPGQSIRHFIYIVASTFLCMLITLIGVIKSIADQRDQMLIKVQDYLSNTYPIEVYSKNKDQNMKELLIKIEKLETELESYQKKGSETKKEAQEAFLKETDIKDLLEKFNIHS
jgi:hypothetical protein